MVDSPDHRPAHTIAGTDEHRIGAALTRLESALARRPGFGRTSNTSTTENLVGLRCRTDENDHRIETDLPPALGGTATGPTPSTLLRAALGSCLAMSYRLRAARHGVELGAIRVTVETDSALAGMLLTDSTVPPGFLEIRYHAEIEAGAPASEIEQLVAEADRLSPVLDAVRASRLSPSLSIIGGRG